MKLICSIVEIESCRISIKSFSTKAGAEKRMRRILDDHNLWYEAIEEAIQEGEYESSSGYSMKLISHDMAEDE